MRCWTRPGIPGLRSTAANIHDRVDEKIDDFFDHLNERLDSFLLTFSPTRSVIDNGDTGEYMSSFQRERELTKVLARI